MKFSNNFFLENELQKIINKKCWAVVCGKGTGSYLSFQIGKKIKLDQPSKNNKLTKEERSFEGEYCLFIENCLWRLTQNSHIICDSADDNAEGDKMIIGIKKLEGKTILKVLIKNTARDIKIMFENNFLFETASDPELSRDYEKYTLFTKDQCISVLQLGEIQIERKELIIS